MTAAHHATLKPWVKHFPPSSSPGEPGAATVLFPHAGGAATALRPLATALSTQGADTFVMQYPQRADRLADPAPETLEALADELFAAADWRRAGALRLFGHCMGALVAFEFARRAESQGIPVPEVWVSAGQAPWTVAGSPPAPLADHEVLADMVDLDGTDPRLLADPDFVELLLMAVRADYSAFNNYSCDRNVRIGADVHALGGSDDHRISEDMLRGWEFHTDGAFTCTLFDGGHFYINDHIDTVAELIGRG
ncbi:thioesterase II family protein [Mycolicibacterium brumae]|uniref:Thioesterase TesA n=1 Tax=Mycolicibacterium brumae TaxID=85968 RepID=A0A2G5P7T7_9MYCO|nr:thioesterase domain-containing protein [Mycolicibacterium brumae]MCV7194770.1 thioesterase [Mycolicibacterium brumae]PIB74326.1 thioesterase [Mycolicibacterium brumae]UWW08197.1 thioesterase domain-containing protein [Mycolicibacterium brumae]